MVVRKSQNLKIALLLVPFERWVSVFIYISQTASLLKLRLPRNGALRQPLGIEASQNMHPINSCSQVRLANFALCRAEFSRVMNSQNGKFRVVAFQIEFNWRKTMQSDSSFFSTGIFHQRNVTLTSVKLLG